MNELRTATLRTQSASALTTNSVLRNTYLLLGATLGFSTLAAALAMAIDMPVPHPVILLVSCFGLLIATMKTRNSSWGLLWVFAFTGFMGLILGPIVNMYLKRLPNGAEVVMMALGTTAVAFVGLSAYAIRSGRDFSFMRGFLLVGLLSAVVLSLVTLFFNLPMVSLAVSVMVVLLMSGLILYRTSEIIHGGETNYISATIGLYLSIYNLFLSLLNIFAGSNRN